MTSVQNQGNQQIQGAIPQIKPAYSQQSSTPQVQSVTQGYNTVPTIPTAPVAPPPTLQAPVVQQTPAAQSSQSPSYAGVNIQIYNPSVGIPNINPTGNMPQSQSLPGIAYPSNYYTQQFVPQPQPQIIAQGGQGGNATVYNTNNIPPTSSGGIGNSIGNSQDTSNAAAKDITNATTTTTENKETTKTEEKKKTEKRKVVELTDEYIKNLENYLNSQDKEVRMMGAKEVVARLQEDDSRKDDPALTALINKMLQDPDQHIRILALSMLDARVCTGNDYTVNVLKKMQNSTSGYGQDAAQATNILLKMSGKVVEKEFEVPENSSKK